jgi:uncharacterized membrane protein YoaK (UPF0700 family)
MLSPSPSDRSLGTRRQTAILLVLSFSSGATDAFAFLSLGGIFTANMTGNLVLIGLVQRPDYLQTLIGATTAVVFFIAALFAGFRIIAVLSHPSPGRNSATFRLLFVTSVVQALIVVGWLGSGSASTLDSTLRFGLVALSSIAMAFQTVIGRQVSGNTGISTTFVTGTITTLVHDLVAGKSTGWLVRAASVVALVAGAFAGSGAIVAGRDFGPILPLLTAVVATVLSARARVRVGA